MFSYAEFTLKMHTWRMRL